MSSSIIAGPSLDMTQAAYCSWTPAWKVIKVPYQSILHSTIVYRLHMSHHLLQDWTRSLLLWLGHLFRDRCVANKYQANRMRLPGTNLLLLHCRTGIKLPNPTIPPSTCWP